MLLSVPSVSVLKRFDCIFALKYFSIARGHFDQNFLEIIILNTDLGAFYNPRVNGIIVEISVCSFV